MSDLKRAIEEIQAAIGSDSLTEYPSDEALTFALAALREQEEREKGCEYCNPNPYGHGEAIKQLITQKFSDGAHFYTMIRGDGLHTVAYPSPEDTKMAKTYSKCCIIKYCPMCGRRLEVKHNG